MSPLKILVADDDTNVRKMLTKMLNRAGHNVEEATNGDECLDRVKDSEDYDAIFLDILMPERDGIETLLELKKLPQSTKIIAMSGGGIGAATDYLSIAKSLGADQTLKKPFSLEEIYDALQFLFQIKIPHVSKSSLRAQSKKRNTSLTPSHNSLQPRLKVLSVDDNPINQTLIESLLKKQYGIEPDIAVDGSQALAQLEHTPYDLILMDCMMPTMDGYAATRAIRSGICGSHAKSIPIIAITANAAPGDREKCLSSGMDDYIPKPLRPGDLSRVIDQWTNYQHETVEPQKRASLTSSQRLDENACDAIQLSDLVIRHDNDTQFVKDLLELFISEVTSLIRRIAKTTSKEIDYEELRFLVQNVRGSAAEVGAPSLIEASLKLEEACIGRKTIDQAEFVSETAHTIQCAKLHIQSIKEA